MHLIQSDESLVLQIIATNMHLSPEFGLTYQDIEKDGFTINRKVEMMLSSDSANGTVKSIGLATIGFADSYEDLKPDLIMVLGDRFEILAAVTAALIYKIPVAHLHGGELTEGAYDDAIRHAITKMSHLHFTSTEEYRKRVIQLGEHPDHVYNVGALGIENIKKCQLLTKPELEASIDFNLGSQFLLVTFHPVTLDAGTAREQFENLLTVLDQYPEYKIIFTLPNSDTGGRVIIDKINNYVEHQKMRCIQFKSMGLIRYLSALMFCSAVIGNSSSGIIEAPSFGVPTLNIGDRQKGRLQAESIYNCGTQHTDIESGLAMVLSSPFTNKARTVNNPYEKTGTSQTILDMIKTQPLDNLIRKNFYDLKQ
jgi:UDP-N-acetylglucosamine 2-epimerase (non-hydrolysing)/GDP/UDP-N,N'-diacetylbacillosamine 2-epimerase (hydrolysing)